MPAPALNGNHTTTMKIVSWNIHSCIGNDRVCDPLRVVDAINSIDFDVICLQEVGWHLRGDKGFDQFRLFQERIPGSHFSSLTKTENAQFGNLIISRLPIKMTSTICLGRRWGIPRLMQVCDLVASNTVIHVLNTHLGLDPFERRAQIRTITEYVSSREGNDPIFLCGDFNAVTNGRSISRLGNQFDEARSFRSFPSKYPVLNLDRIFARGFERYVNFAVLDEEIYASASDHIPVQSIVAI